MAEENNNTLSFLDPTEPLGPITGSTNLPSTDPVNMQPFEGDKFSVPEINFPTAVYNRQYAVDPTIETKENVVGKPGEPAKTKNLNAKINIKDIAEAYMNKTLATGRSIAQNANAYSKPYSYDATPHANSFYDRYYGYGQETFDKIGFSPLQDNETVFNASTSGWDDFSRMMSQSWLPLFTTGFVSGPKSLYRALQGDFGVDTDDAEIYERAAAIGQSSRGGFGPFMSNAFMNFGYTAGIITETMLEMGAAALLAAPSGGSSLVAEGALLGNKARMLGQGLSGLSKLKNATTANQFRNSLQSLKSVDNARKFYNFTKAEKTFTSPLGTFLNPLSNTTEALFNVAKNSKNLTGLAKTRQVFGGFWQDIATINAAYSESRLEGGMVENKVYRELYNDFYRENGFAPDDNKQEEFRLQAKDAGIAALALNVPIIYGTNRLVFDNILGGKGAMNRLFGRKMSDVMDLKTGKIIRSYTKKTIGKKTIKVPTAKYVENNLKNTVANFFRQPLRKSTVGAITYFKANFAEGIQENFQEAIALGTEKYYIESFKNPALATSEFARAATKEGIMSQFTKQGFEVFASGFVMGMFAGPLNRAPSFASMAYKRFSDPKAYQKYKDLKKNYGERLVNQLNAVDVKDFYESRIFNYGSQATINNELKKQTSEDTEAILKENAFVDGVSTALEHDTLDIYTEQLKEYKNLTQEEFEEATGLEAGEGVDYQQKIDIALDNIKSIEKSWKDAKERFPDPIDFTKTSTYDENSPEYEKAILLENAWKIARRNYVFFNYGYKNTRKRMLDTIQSVLAIPEIGDVNAQDVQVLFEDNLLLNQINILESEVESLERLDKIPNQKDYNFKKKQINTLKELQSAISIYKNAKKNKAEVKAQVKVQLGLLEEDYSPEELEMFAEEIYNTNQRFISPASVELEKAFKSYIQLLADKSGTYTFDENLDKAFESFSKYFELDRESRDLASSINILHDPLEYMEHVERNMKWMKDLYDNRRSYYTEMVNKGFEDLEDNEILNWLASRNIYVNIDEFEKWKKEGIIPKEFYDDTKKAVIREGHHQYNDYAVIFYRALLVRSKKEEVVDKVYKDKIDALIKQRDAEINALDKVEQRVDKNKIEPKRLSKSFTIKRVDEKSFSGQYIELTLKEDGTTITLYKDKEGNLRYDNEDGELFDMKSKDKYTSGQTYIIDFVPDPKEVERVVKEYDDKIAKLKSEATAEVKKSGLKPNVITKDTPLDDMPTELAEAIVNAYVEQQISLNIPVEQEPTDEQIISFIKTSRVAADLINKYNADQELNDAVTDPEYDPELIVNGETKKASDFSETELRKMKKILTGQLKVLEEKKDKTNEDQVEINRTQATINQIDAYLKNLDKTQMTPEQKKTISILENLLQKQKEELTTPKDGLKAYMVDDVILDRVTNKTKELKYQKYEYEFLADALVIYNETVKNNKATEEDITKIIGEFKKKRPQGYSEKSFIKLETELLRRKDNLTAQVLETAINEFQNQETRDAGKYIDKAVRDMFSGADVKFDPNIITAEAFEELFGENGSITNIVKLVKDNGLYLMSEELTLYDKDARVAGTVDLVAVDRSGKVYIIDIKTGKKNKWDKFDTHPSKEAYTLQQAAYRNLLYNMTGLPSSISLFPIEVNDVVKDGKITKGTLPKSSKGKIRIQLDSDDSFHKDGPLEGKTVQELIDSIIPVKAKPGKPAPVAEPTMQVGRQLSEAMMNKLNRIGLEGPIIKLMTDEEIEFVKTTLDETELSNFANSIIKKYGDQVVTETKPVTDTETEKEKVVQTKLAGVKIGGEKVKAAGKKVSVGDELSLKIEEGTEESPLTYPGDTAEYLYAISVLNKDGEVIGSIPYESEAAELIRRNENRARVSVVALKPLDEDATSITVEIAIPTEKQFVEEVKGSLSFKPTVKTTTKETQRRFEGYLSEITNAKTEAQLDEISSKIKNTISEFSTEQANQLREAYNTQKQKLEAVTEATESNVNVGNEFIVRNNIPAGKELFGQVGETLKVTKVKGNEITLQNSEGKTLSLSIQDLNSVATFKSNMGKEVETPTEVLDNTDKENIGKSNDEVDNFINTAKLAEIDSNTEDVTEEDTRNNVLDDLDC